MCLWFSSRLALILAWFLSALICRRGKLHQILGRGFRNRELCVRSFFYYYYYFWECSSLLVAEGSCARAAACLQERDPGGEPERSRGELGVRRAPLRVGRTAPRRGCRGRMRSAELGEQGSVASGVPW